MSEIATPRWGNQGRDKKALAVWNTLSERCGASIADRAWLDVGCGSGGIAAALAVKVRHITGIDPEPWAAWVDAMSKHDNLELKHAVFDGDEPPIPDESIDVVICNQVYEHVADPAALLRNIQRVLRPNGVCYFAGPNLLWPIEPHVFWPFVHWFPRQSAQAVMRMLGSSQADALDAWTASFWRLRLWFRGAGLMHECALRERLCAGIESSYLKWLVPIVRKVPRYAFSVMAPLSPGFVFILRKPGE